ncbi:MAG TPA: PAS domain-containing protein [Terriglobales bacterium]|nr:PAS domain-containing protein [Terriglobales bacterium]
MTDSPQPNPGLASEAAALRAMNAGLRAALDLVDAYVYTKDRAGRYTFANQKVRQLFGRSLDDICGRDDSDFFDLALSNELKANDARVMEEAQTFEREERNIVKSTGEERIYWTVKSPLRDDRGEVIGMCGVSTDITGRPRN